jgi:hypothetical protein
MTFFCERKALISIALPIRDRSPQDRSRLLLGNQSDERRR